MEPPEIPNLQHITLPTKPACPIAYTFTTLHEADTITPAHAIWLIFINGLGLPQAFWQPIIHLLRFDLADNSISPPSTIYTTTYDRYGQGLSRPTNVPPEPHDITDSVSDLEAILSQIHQIHLSHQSQPLKRILVAHSIGVPLARLFLSQSQTSPTTAFSAALFLDSNIANIDLTSLLPDPLSPSFAPQDLPTDTTLSDLQIARTNYTRLFSPSAPNPENLDRTTLPALLPHANGPIIQSADENPFRLTIVAHDAETFAEESVKICTRGLTSAYIEPVWRAYNEGLMELGDSQSVVAKGSGHFVQKDRPRCVADEVWRLVARVNGFGRDG